VQLDKMQGLLPAVLQEAWLHRVMEVGYLELVVVLTPRVLQFGSHMRNRVGLLVVGLLGMQALVVVLGGQAQSVYVLGMECGMGL